MKTKNPQVVCFGEVLWDIFPDYKVIGGAPLNVALRMQSFGITTAMISAVGDDDLGNEILKYAFEKGLKTDFIQVSNKHATGTVEVFLNDEGSASYTIHKPVAWDFIELTNPNTEVVSNPDVFIFGSLVCRHSVSKETLLHLINASNISVFDVNLRPPDYSLDLIFDLMTKADIIKLNDDELDIVADYLDCTEKSLKEKIKSIAEVTKTNCICITKGSKGAMLLMDGKFYANKGYKVGVADTVGAGDSFLASLIYKLIIQKTNPEDALDFACKIGALVASKSGANAVIQPEELLALSTRT